MRFVREGKRVARFSVQLVSFIGGEWKPIVRYDTSHGGVHIDILHPDGSKETRELPQLSLRDGLTFAQRDIKARWRFYREHYKREMR